MVASFEVFTSTPKESAGVTIRRVRDWMIGLIAPYRFTTRDYRQYSNIADLHTLQFTVTHALWFSVFTSRILATNL
jgi:hypothetical protein